MNTQHSRWMIGFTATLVCFLIANLIAVHIRSDFGLLEGLGVVDRAHDDIRRIGFPFQFYEEGGFVHRQIFSFAALVSDLVLGLVCSAVVGFTVKWAMHKRDVITSGWNE